MSNNNGMTREEIVQVQIDLKLKGFDPGPVDGIMGPNTESAIVAFKRSHGLRPRPYIGPITMKKLKEKLKPGGTRPDPGLPWIVEANKVLRLHEVENNLAISEWLRSDGHALGDPAQFPWCGDFVETAIRLALPKEKIPKNPYWALNWRKFGKPCKPSYGCVYSIKRNGGGHVGFLVGEDSGRYYSLGGNQANRVSIVPVAKSRFSEQSFRWPLTSDFEPGKLPRMTSAEAANTQEG